MQGKGVVVADPFITVYELTRDDACVVLACDGVYERLTHPEVAAFVAAQLRAGASAEEAARRLVHHALDRGSQDNVSAVVVQLRWK